MIYLNDAAKPSSINRGLIKESYIKNNNTCKVTMAEKVVFSRMESIDYPENSPLTKPIDREYVLFIMKLMNWMI